MWLAFASPSHTLIKSRWVRSHDKAAREWTITSRAKSSCSLANHSRDQSAVNVLCKAEVMVSAV